MQATRARSIVFGGLALLSGLLLVAAFFWDSLLDRAVEDVILAVQADENLLEPDSLKLMLCGTGAPAMDPTASSACSAVIAAREVLMVDVGAGGVQRLSADRVPLSALSTILVTHLHSDHIGGLGDALNISVFLGRQRPIHVFGPPGIAQVVEGFTAAYAEDARLRSHPEGGFIDPQWTLPTIRVVEIEGDEAVTVLEREGLRVSAFAVDHHPVRPAYGYRFDYRGRSIAFSGDTRLDERLIGHAAGADILVHSAMGLGWLAERAIPILERRGMQREARLLAEGQRVFATPVEVAGVAASADVGTLVFSHKPPVPRAGETIWLWGVSDVFGGRVVVGRDGMRFDLPVR